MKKWIAMLALCFASASVFAQQSSTQNAQTQNAQTQAMPAQNAPSMQGMGMGGSAHMQQMMQQLQERFTAANTTRDGKLTKQQAQLGMPRVAQHFDQIDTQKVGYVTLPQIEQFLATQRRE
ncbi:EF-hand domain-containing protein [Paraburkholderia edwinii]|uniref:EF-hand domain-containing protein n=1 Tax=Paraburkholderia edwinii TaxID=2861782 RepID=A0ABX8UL76_9BURK|nr:EF-hand domain-containing protein [Paraburkholderia edwinii]QYD69780.1 EF-hand domain-containing protein [Paraburkholderia edwinii]